MWILYLNPMVERSDAEVPVARAESREALEQFLQSEQVESYTDSQERFGHGGFCCNWHKVYRKGGPLEWYNPPTSDDQFRDVGTLEDMIERYRQHLLADLERIPEVLFQEITPTIFPPGAEGDLA